ncbi:leucine-rich repeat domain-containing protein [Levilactobacillus tongjiangensis]|uniref:leucine-rich repeat domain-containing protein n=1 Tax=Levilactobacillus tongjiangensis TaxID=2486023 RepID=UPI001CDCDD59|nr:leucine-rich repeat domain-containing protein [Levilactobacillus tongjiangensis]
MGESAFQQNNRSLTGTLKVPDSVSFIGKNAFSGDSLTNIDFGKSTGTIGESAFAGNQMTGDPETGILTLSDGIQQINDAAFAGNLLKGVKLGTGLITIGNSAFAANPLTGTLTIPDLVTSIGEYAFTNGKLTGLILGQKVDSIGSSAFAENQLAGALEIPDSVKSIGDSAFASNKLRALQLDGTVNSVGIGTFAGNDLQKIQAAQPVTNLGDYALAGQKTLAVTVNKSGNQLTGVRAAIAKQLQLQNFSLTDPMIFKLGDTPVTYDFKTDSLTLPAGVTGNSLTLSLSSGTTGEATDHSGNYGVDALTLSWSVPASGTDPTTPTTPTEPTDPVTPTIPTTPKKPTKPTKPGKKPQTPTSPKAHQHRTGDTKRAGQRQVFTYTGSVVGNGTQRGLKPTAWSYGQQASSLNVSSKVSGLEHLDNQNQSQPELPQTSEQTSYWSVIGTTILAALSWLGLGERRRRH